MSRHPGLSPKIIVAVLTWNKCADVLELLVSLQKIRYDNFKIAVVDNNSTDGTAQAIRSQFPSVHLFLNKRNVGTAGFNRAMQFAFECDADFIFILEDGTTVDPDILKELLAVAESNGNIGVVCPKIYRYDKPEMIWIAGGTYLNMLTGGHYGSVMNVPDEGSHDVEKDFDVFPGGFLFVRMPTLAQAGMFDPDYFLYRDDDDWCMKVKQAGWRLVYAPKAKAWHKPSASVGLESPTFYYYRTRNQLLFMKKNATLPQWACFLPYFVFQQFWHMWYPLAREKEWPKLGGCFRGVYDFCCGRVGQWKKVSSTAKLRGRMLGKFRKVLLFIVDPLRRACLLIAQPLRTRRGKRFLSRATPPARILIAFFGRGLGDCLYFSGILQILRRKFPLAKIHLAVFKQKESYFKNHPSVDKVFACPDYYRNGLIGYLRFLISSGAARREGSVDLFLEMCPNLAMPPAFWKALIPSRYSIGLGDSWKRLFYDRPVPIDWQQPFYKAILNGLAPLGVSDAQPNFWIPRQEDISGVVPAAVESSGAVVLAPGGSRAVVAPKEFRWAEQTFPYVAEQLATKGIYVILTGTEDDRAMAGVVHNPRILDLIGKTSLSQLFTLVRRCARLVVSNNSGLLHVAGVLGIPSVSHADDQKNVSRWSPYPGTSRHRVLQDAPGRHVSREDFLEAILKELEQHTRNSFQDGYK